MVYVVDKRVWLLTKCTLYEMKGGLPNDIDISAHSPKVNLSHQSPDSDVFLVNYLANIILPQLNVINFPSVYCLHYIFFNGNFPTNF